MAKKKTTYRFVYEGMETFPGQVFIEVKDVLTGRTQIVLLAKRDTSIELAERRLEEITDAIVEWRNEMEQSDYEEERED